MQTVLSRIIDHPRIVTLAIVLVTVFATIGHYDPDRFLRMIIPPPAAEAGMLRPRPAAAMTGTMTAAAKRLKTPLAEREMALGSPDFMASLERLAGWAGIIGDDVMIQWAENTTRSGTGLKVPIWLHQGMNRKKPK
mgnify:CR=1 FL=1